MGTAYNVDFQDTKDGSMGTMPHESIEMAIAQAFAFWNASDYRHVRVVRYDQRLIMQLYAKKGLR